MTPTTPNYAAVPGRPRETTASTAHLIGRTGILRADGKRRPFDTAIAIHDARQSFGRTDVLAVARIMPLDGSAAAWVDLASVTLDEPETGR